MVDKLLSDKIKIASFLCTVMVVYRHSLNHEAFFGEWRGETCCGFIEASVSILTEVAVPFFFIISGFFFFRKSYYKKGEYFDIIKKKTQTLFLPFVIWNILGICPLLIAGQFEFRDSFLDYGKDLLQSNWYGALWYVRDLLSLILLVPLYGWIFSINKGWLYVLVGGVVFYFWVPVDCGWISTEGIFFFFMGGVLQKHNKFISKQFPLWLTCLLVIVWISMSLTHPYWEYIHKVNTFIGVVAFWQILNSFSEAINVKILVYVKYSFFIYVTHLYMIKSMKVTLADYFFGNEIVALTAYAILPIITIVLTIIIGKLWSYISPKSFSIATGGRG